MFKLDMFEVIADDDASKIGVVGVFDKVVLETRTDDVVVIVVVVTPLADGVDIELIIFFVAIFLFFYFFNLLF